MYLITHEAIGKTPKKFNPIQLQTEFKKQGSLFTVSNILYQKDSSGLAHIISAGNDGQLMIRKSLLTKEASRMVSQQALENVLKNIMVDPEFELNDIQISESQILFNNGILNLKDGKFTPKDMSSRDNTLASVIFLYKINANYIEDAKFEDAPAFSNYLETSLEGDVIPLFLEALGYILSPVQKMKKAVFLNGKANTGKSLILEFIRQILGPQFVSELDLTQIGQTNANGPLLGKQCNISEDIGSTNSFNISAFKLAVANENVRMSNKYERATTAPVRAKFIIGGNAFPQVPTMELPPFIERVILIPFTRDIPPDKRDPNLIIKLWDEKDIIASILISEFVPVFNSRRFASSETSNKALKQVINEANPAKAFIEDYIISYPSGYIRSQDFKRLLETYCLINGYDKPKLSVARRQLLQIYHTNIVRKRFSDDLGNVQAFEHIAFKKKRGRIT